MFVSLLPVVTVVSLGLVVPASLAALLLARGRHASFSSGGDRRGRVAVAAALVAVAGGTVGALLGAGPAEVAAASLLLTGPVLVWAVLAPWWPVRAVVAWAMLVTGSVGLVALATGRALESSVTWSALPVAGAGSAAVVFVLRRINGPFRRVLGIRAGIRKAVRAPLFLRPALIRPALTLAVFFAAMAVGGLTGVSPRPGGGGWSEAGPGTAPGSSDGPGAVDGSDVRPVSADTTTRSGSARGEGSVPIADGYSSDLTGADSAFTSATPRPDGSTALTGYGTGADPSSTPGSGGSTADSPTGTDGTPDLTSAPVGSEPAGEPDPAEVLQSDPVTEVIDTVHNVTEPVEQVTEPVQDGGEETVEPVQAVVEETVEPVQAAVEETVKPVKAAVEETVKPVKAAVEETVEQVTDPLSSALP